MPQQTKSNDEFERIEDRQMEATLTNEFLRIACDIQQKEKQIKIVREFAKRLENTMSVVCDAKRVEHGVKIVAFRTNDADAERVERAFQDMQGEIAYRYGED